jgi:hemolysin activation/secretion protein
MQLGYMYKFGVSILFIVVNLFFLDLSFSKEKINHSINGTIDFQLQKVIFDGVTVYKREELISLIRPLIAKNPDFNSKKLQEEVKLAIHKKYIQDGYAGSFAYKVSYNKKKGTLNIFALEGRVSSFYIPKEALRIKYVREYADKILNMRIFNMKEAKPYFVHLRNILGSGSDFHINLLDKLDEKDISKTIDIFYAIDAKYKGVFSIHNYRTPDEHTENVFKDTELLTSAPNSLKYGVSYI